MKRDLGAQPHIEHLKTQAKDLLKALHRGEAGAVARFRDSLPAAHGLSDDAIGRFALHDAQSVIAREYGFDGWAALRAHVVAPAPMTPELLRALMKMPLPPEVEASLREASTSPPSAPRALPDRLPVIAVRNAVLTVGSVVPLEIGRATSAAAIEAAQREGGALGVFAQTSDLTEAPTLADLHTVGCAAQLVSVHPRDAVRRWIVLRGVRWIELTELEATQPYLLARVAPFDVEPSSDVGALERELRQRARKLACALPDSKHILQQIDVMQPLELADAVVANLSCTVQEKAGYARRSNLRDRLASALELIERSTLPAG